MKRMVVPAMVVVVMAFITAYLLGMEPDRWCTSGIEEMEIRGEMMKTCPYESRDGSGNVRVKSWETEDKEYIYREFYKGDVPQYSITYWSEGNKRCSEIKRINNRFVPEGVECTDI